MKADSSRIKTMAETPPLRAILILASPVVLAMLVQVLYNMVDTFFIGMMNDVNQLAAANVGFPFFMLTMAAGSVIGVGSASVISRYIGMGKKKEAGEIVGLSFALVVALALAVTIAGLLGIDRAVSLLGARDSVVGPTKAYLTPLIIGAAIIMTNLSIGVELRAEGAAVDTTIGMVLGSVVNIILDPIMIFAFHWGIAGAAWATVIGNAAGLAWYVRCYARSSMLNVTFGKHSWNPEYLREIFSIGIPSGLNQALMSVSAVISNNVASTYGAITLGAMGVALKVNSLIILILIGLATGCQPLFGYNYGARNAKRLKAILKTGMILSAAVGAFLLAVYTFAGKHLIALFSQNPEVIAKGAYMLTAVSSAAPVIGPTMLVINCLQAIGKPMPSLILSTGRQGLFYIPLLFILNALFGFNGFVFTQPIVDALMLVTTTLTMRYVLNKDTVLHATPVAGAA